MNTVVKNWRTGLLLPTGIALPFAAILTSLSGAPAFAACSTTGVAPGQVTVTCAANTATTATTNSTSPNPSTSDATQSFNANVVGTVNSGVTVSANGLALTSTAAAGSVSLTNNGTISATGQTILTLTGNGGGASYSGGGDLTSTGPNSSVLSIVNNFGGTGAVMVNATGGTFTANGNTVRGIDAYQNGTSGGISITTSNTTAINLVNTFSGSTDYGISANTNATSGDLIINSGSHIYASGASSFGFVNGITATQSGSGNLSITSSGIIDMSGTTQTASGGIIASHGGTGNLTTIVNANIIAGTGGATGINANFTGPAGTGTGTITVANGVSITAGSSGIIFDDAFSGTMAAHQIMVGVGTGATVSGTNSVGIRVGGTNFDLQLTNAGTVSSTNGYGVIDLGKLTGMNTGTISGGTGGIQANKAGSNFINAGVINGGAGNAIQFVGTGNTLTLQNGTNITGNVIGGGSAANTLQLGGTTGSPIFNVSLIGTQYQDFNTFNKINSGLWTLSGTGTQIWNVSGGVLAGTAGVGTGSIQGNIFLSNGATLDFNQSSNGHYQGLITGAGNLAKDGTGITSIDNTQGYTGTTTVNGGTLQVSTANALPTGTAVTVGTGASAATLDLQFAQTVASISGNASGVIALNASTLTTGDATNTTFAGVITGGATGQLVKQGTGTFTLTGDSSYTGMTTISAGTLQLGNGGSTGSVAGNITDNATLAVNHSAAFTIASVISGNGAFQQNGSGTTTLSNTNLYTGATSVNAGTLSVNGSIASSSMTTVNAGATLGGNGTVGNTTINGGTLSPGNSIGLLTVQGNLVFTAAASYLVEVSPANADRTNVTGSASLGGASVAAIFGAGSYVAKQYTIVNATGGVTGTFSGPVLTNLPSGFQSSLSYDAKNAYLNLTLNFVPPPTTPTSPTSPTPPSGPTLPSGLNTNQQNVANALIGFFNSNGGIPLVYGTLTPVGLTQASGEIATAPQQTTFNAMNQFLGVLTDPFIAGRGDGMAFGGNTTGYADEALAYAQKRKANDALASIYTKAPPLAPTFESRWSVWAAGYGGSQTTDGNTTLGSNNTISSIYGTAVGADYRFSPNLLAGFALAGGGTNFSVNGLGSGRSDLFQAGAFLRYNNGPAYITAAAAYGWQDITTNRSVTIAGFDQLRAEFNANTYSGRVEGGYRFVTPAFGGIGITPYGAGQFTTFELPSYAESVVTGTSAFALAYAAKSVTDTVSELGLRSDKSFAMPDGIFTLRGRAAWAHDFDPDRSIAATFQSLPGASFVVNGAQQARDSALTTASAEMKWVNGWSAAATFEGQFSEVTRSYAGKGVVRYTW